MDELGKASIMIPNNLPAFACNVDGEMNLTEEYKNPIETHNH